MQLLRIAARFHDYLLSLPIPYFLCLQPEPQLVMVLC